MIPLPVELPENIFPVNSDFQFEERAKYIFEYLGLSAFSIDPIEGKTYEFDKADDGILVQDITEPEEGDEQSFREERFKSIRDALDGFIIDGTPLKDFAPGQRLHLFTTQD